MLKTFNQFVNENSTQTYDYGCVMIYFAFPGMEQLHQTIVNEDIYTEDADKSYGLEDEPHCTLLYGLHKEVTLEQVTQVLDKYTFTTVKAHNASLFENEKYDVLKFDIAGDNLHEANTDLKQFPFTSNFPNYHPHMTVGYIKPGKGKQYADQLANKEFWIAPQYAVYSQPDGSKHTIAIKID
jgi:2'-5' RNA ligase